MRRVMPSVLIAALVIGATHAPSSRAEAPSPPRQRADVLIDTDFGLPPIDDAFAVGLVLNSPEARVVAITTVAGNQPLDTENTELQGFMERMGRLDVPLYSGAEYPLSLDARLASGEAYAEKLKSGSVIPLVREFMPKPDSNRGDVAGYTYFFDPLAATGIVAPELSVKSRFYVDVDTNLGINYGASVRRSATPRYLINLGALLTMEKLTVNLVEKIYGPSSDYENDDGDNPSFNFEFFKDQIGVTPITNLDVAYQFTDHLELSAGAINLFNRFPNKVNATILERENAYVDVTATVQYPVFSPFGINGGFYYVKAAYRF